MTAVTLFKGVTAAQTMPTPVQGVPPPANLPPGNLGYQVIGGAGSSVLGPAGITWQAILKAASAGVSGSATVNPLVSNDGLNWSNAAINLMTIPSGPAPQTAISSTASNFVWIAAYVSAIGGVGATCDCVANV